MQQVKPLLSQQVLCHAGYSCQVWLIAPRYKPSQPSYEPAKHKSPQPTARLSYCQTLPATTELEQACQKTLLCFHNQAV